MKNFLCVILFLFCSHMLSFQLDRVILATDDNPNYIQFWPIAAKAWQEIVGIKPTLALVAHDNVHVDTTYGDVIRFEPIEGVPTSLYAQCIRLLLPCLFPDDICILSDIDLMPLQRNFFTKNVVKFHDDSFVIYRDRLYYSWYSKWYVEKDHLYRYYMNYIAAKGSTFQEIFGITSIDQIPGLIKQWYQLGIGWATDEKVLYNYVNAWRKKGNKKRIKKLGYGYISNRISRTKNLKYSKKKLEKSYYVELNCARPYSQYKEQIDLIMHIALLAAAKKNS